MFPVKQGRYIVKFRFICYQMCDWLFPISCCICTIHLLNIPKFSAIGFKLFLPQRHQTSSFMSLLDFRESGLLFVFKRITLTGCHFSAVSAYGVQSRRIKLKWTSIRATVTIENLLPKLTFRYSRETTRYNGWKFLLSTLRKKLANKLVLAIRTHTITS